MKTVIVGGVAAGASTGARLRRLDESAEIVVLERDPYVSFANCGLPYHIGGDIDLEHLELAYAPPYGSAKDPVDRAGFLGARTCCAATSSSGTPRTTPTVPTG